MKKKKKEKEIHRHQNTDTLSLLFSGRSFEPPARTKGIHQNAREKKKKKKEKKKRKKEKKRERMFAAPIRMFRCSYTVDLLSSGQGSLSICALRLAHNRSFPPRSYVPFAAFETVPAVCLKSPAPVQFLSYTCRARFVSSLFGFGH